jgi:hypothetical protein
MNRDDLARLVLLEVARQTEAARSRPRPPRWQTWNVWLYEADLEYGPKYSPTWFGDLTATEAGRVRTLRAVYRLSDAGLLLLTKSEGGRLERVQLTEAGQRAVDELEGAVTMSPAYT